MRKPGAYQLVAVVGGSGAGKSWLVGQLRRLLGEKAGHLALDDFYTDLSHLAPSRREEVNLDTPEAIDWECLGQVLADLRAGTPTLVPRFDLLTRCRLAERLPWSPRPLVLVEGLWLLRSPALRRLFDLKIFLDSPAPLRLRRRLLRDVSERGRTAAEVKHAFKFTISRMHRRHVEPQRKWADLVLTQPLVEIEVRALADRFWVLLETGSLLPAWMRETFRAELLALLTQDAARN